jgi:hypothetical protein
MFVTQRVIYRAAFDGKQALDDKAIAPGRRLIVTRRKASSRLQVACCCFQRSPPPPPPTNQISRCIASGTYVEKADFLLWKLFFVVGVEKGGGGGGGGGRRGGGGAGPMADAPPSIARKHQHTLRFFINPSAPPLPPSRPPSLPYT